HGPESGARTSLARKGAGLRPSPEYSKGVLMSNFPKTLRAMRKRYFCKQLALARACECSTAHISWLESGKRCPSCAMLGKLKTALLDARVDDRQVARLLAQAKIDIIEHRLNGLEGQRH